MTNSSTQQQTEEPRRPLVTRLERLPGRPPGVFRGTNFMTPSPVAYFRGQYLGRSVCVEVAKENRPYWADTVGGGPPDTPLVGVTIKRSDGRAWDPLSEDPSLSVHGLDEAWAVLGLPQG